VTDRIARGVVSIKEGAWFTLDANGQDTRGCANVLTADVAAPSGASTFNTCFVDIAPAAGDAASAR
jgi:anaerobic dimethyl sulfoxide reductase subunit A